MPEFGAPGWLFALLLVPALGLLLARGLFASARARHEFAPQAIWRRMGLIGDERSRALRGGLLLLAVALLVFGLADPRSAGKIQREEIPRLMVLLDVSKSMLARDAVMSAGVLTGSAGRTRFDAGRALIREVIGSLPGWQIGLLVFAAEPLVLCPMTDDANAAVTLLERAKAGEEGIKGGTNLEAALRAATALTGKGTILVVSDGEELSGRTALAAKDLARRKIAVVAVGMGHDGPTPLLIGGEALSWHGRPVMTRRVDSTLGGLAKATGGAYLASTLVSEGAGSLGVGQEPPPGHDMAVAPNSNDVLAKLHGPSAQRKPGATQRRTPLLLAMLVLALDAILAFGWRFRGPRVGPKTPINASETHTSNEGSWEVPGRRLERSGSAILWLVPAAAALVGWTWPSIPLVLEGVSAYRKGEASRSASLFAEAARRDPTDPTLRYDLGNALHVGGRMRPALEAYDAALARANPKGSLAEKTHYNIGNTYYRMANFAAAASAYRKALAIDPKDEDARHNLDLAEEKLTGARQAAAQSTGAGKIPNLPSADEVQSLLQALESDERRRQAAAAQQDGTPDPGTESPSEMARRMLVDAKQAFQRESERDW